MTRFNACREVQESSNNKHIRGYTMNTNTSLEIITEEDLADDFAAQPQKGDELNQTFQRTHSSFQDDLDKEDSMQGAQPPKMEQVSPTNTLRPKKKAESDPRS